ncbi:MAG: GNAT family N-acetyltransferase [Intrasporangium sp.]|uniref:GNAT family N-acetyltransferase n=1 Tax=Intrasporangium sp. TaxID=1925024 RepID=UPI00264714AE|nr:GNAT family N-acetyltransferase [Intrasporangium sp.]MDN5794235.1 GNAT family N-acetyltransferase [Intrasporangium sp.]
MVEAGHGHEHIHGHEGHSHEHAGPLADASVRLARDADAPAVGFVQAVVFRDAYAAHLPAEAIDRFEPRPFTKAWRAALAEPPSRDHVLLVACAGEQVVGFAAMAPSADPDAGERTAELTTIAVHPDARRQGHGSRLLNAAVDTARGRGRGELTTWVIGTDDDTRGFLTAAGLVPDGAHRGRVVSPEGETLQEVRLSADVSHDPRSA